MNTNLFKSLLIFAICAGLAVMLGVLVAGPVTLQSLFILGAVVAGLAMPMILRWHHWALILFWNAPLLAAVLPGQLPLWIPLVFVSFGCSILTFALSKERRLPSVPLVTWPLLFFLAVVLFTIWNTGGIGVRALGSEAYGGKRYVYVLTAIAGCFALSWHRIPPDKTKLAVTVFMLAGVTVMVGNIAYLLGPVAYPLLLVFPLQISGGEATSQVGELPTMLRLRGLGAAGQLFALFMLIRFGIAGIFSVRQVGRLVIFVTVCALSLVAGYRSVVALLGLVFLIQFFLEGMHRTMLLPVVVLSIALTASLVLPVVDKLPLSAQRSLSFLPVKIDAMARTDAQQSSEWRFEMWKALLPEVPGHLKTGKGFVIDPTDLYLHNEALRRGFVQPWEGAMAAGDYHSGPLSLVITFGLPGTIGFVWLLVAGGILLVRNYNYGTPEIRTINRGILALYCARVIFFFFIYGAIHNHLAYFTGLIGLSLALNGCAKAPAHAVRAGDASSERTGDYLAATGMTPAQNS